MEMIDNSLIYLSIKTFYKMQKDKYKDIYDWKGYKSGKIFEKIKIILNQ